MTLLGAPAVLLTVLLTGCAAGPGVAPPTGVDQLEIPTPSPDPEDFVAEIDNPWLPLQEGTEWRLASEGQAPTTLTVTVTPETREVAGVTTTVVSKVVTGADGDVVEQTVAALAQDRAGNVWLLAEEVSTTDGRGRSGSASSWEAGVDGARAGLAMPAEPRVGDGYLRRAAGAEQDLVEVLALDGTATVAFGTFAGLLVTEVRTSPEAGAVEQNHYARDVGLVLTEPGEDGGERLELVSFSTR